MAAAVFDVVVVAAAALDVAAAAEFADAVVAAVSVAACGPVAPSTEYNVAEFSFVRPAPP